MDTVTAVPVQNLRLGDAFMIGSREFGRVYALELTYEGNVRISYHVGSGDAVRQDVELMPTGDVVFVRDAQVPA